VKHGKKLYAQRELRMKAKTPRAAKHSHSEESIFDLVT
jgi:hypothetical protein